MYLTRHLSANGPRWALDGHFLPLGFTLETILQIEANDLTTTLPGLCQQAVDDEPLLAPIEPIQEVWASGVTYLRSREARVEESDTADVYEKVYDAERVELFFKANGWRVRGPRDAIRVRKDSSWDVPEPELTLVINASGSIVGYTVGNDVSSRSIEGENPLYLPQAKVYDGSCALGPGILLTDPATLVPLDIALTISRSGETVFTGTTNTGQLKRDLTEIAAWLTAELSFPKGVLLMTGTGIVPPDEFTLGPGDHVRVEVGMLSLENAVSD